VVVIETFYHMIEILYWKPVQASDMI